MQQTPDKHAHKPSPPTIVRDLLEKETQQPIATRTRATLDRRANAFVDRAAGAGIHIEYLGINPLFDEPRLYRGEKTDWILGPASRAEDLVVPGAQRERLCRLVAAGVDVPAVYIAHEVPKERTKPHASAAPAGAVILDRDTADAIIGPVPSPRAAVATAEQLALHSARTLKALGAAAVGLAVAPFALAIGAAASLATLDPIVLGAVPLSTARPGAPAAWLALARWDW